MALTLFTVAITNADPVIFPVVRVLVSVQKVSVVSDVSPRVPKVVVKNKLLEQLLSR